MHMGQAAIWFERAVAKQATCVQYGGRYVGVRGILPSSVSALQEGASKTMCFGLCVPPPCTGAEVGSFIAPYVLYVSFNLDAVPILSGIGRNSDPEVEELTAWSAVAVDFAIIGLSRSGTTTLATYLNRHPDLQLADVGTKPFAEDSSFNGSSLLPSRQFADDFQKQHGTNGSVKVGIKHPHLLFKDLALLKLFAANPLIVLIVLVRDPIDWLESTFRFYDFLNVTKPSFADHAIAGDNAHRVVLRAHGYEAHFTRWIHRLVEFGFRRRQVYVLHLDSLGSHEAALHTMSRLCSFLNVTFPLLGEVPRANVNERQGGFDLCVALRDREIQGVVSQLRLELAAEYAGLPAVLAANGEQVPLRLLQRRSRCD